MSRIDRLRKLFAYDDWANRETLAALDSGGPTPESALKVMAHVLGADRLWLDRLRGRKAAPPVWPGFALPACRDEVASLECLWEDWLDDLDADDLDRTIEYVNSKGERWSSTMADVLDHVLLHSAYHRGQVATLLREAGRQPAYTDYIHCTRQGLIE